jgi:hypothetical protein
MQGRATTSESTPARPPGPSPPGPDRVTGKSINMHYVINIFYDRYSTLLSNRQLVTHSTTYYNSFRVRLGDSDSESDMWSSFRVRSFRVHSESESRQCRVSSLRLATVTAALLSPSLLPARRATSPLRFTPTHQRRHTGTAAQTRGPERRQQTAACSTRAPPPPPSHQAAAPGRR